MCVGRGIGGYGGCEGGAGCYQGIRAHTHTHTHIQTNKQTNKQTYKQTYTHTRLYLLSSVAHTVHIQDLSKVPTLHLRDGFK
jgi:hypothetical protein